MGEGSNKEFSDLSVTQCAPCRECMLRVQRQNRDDHTSVHGDGMGTASKRKGQPHKALRDDREAPQ